MRLALVERCRVDCPQIRPLYLPCAYPPPHGDVMIPHRRSRPRPGWAAPACAVVGWAVTCAVVGGFTTRTLAAILACAGIAVWAGLFVWQRDLRRREDRDAYEHLRLLRDRTCQPGVRLLAVIGTDWANPAGQAAVTVDVNTGRAGAEWFPLAMFAHGSMVLVSSEVGAAPRLHDWMPPGEVEAAHRHHLNEAGRRRRAHRGRSWRRRRALIAEIEAVLRRPVDDTRPGTPDAGSPTDRAHNPWKGTT